MEVSKPLLDTKNQSYLFHVRCTNIQACRIRTIGEPVAKDISGVLALFIAGAQTHFESELEIDDIKHIWDVTYEGAPYAINSSTEIWWIPKRVLMTPFLVSIDWAISSVGPGTDAPAKATPGKAAIHRRRVREARLRTAAAKLRAEQLAESYFAKYGPELLSDAESSLSET
jgi:hypothetical protein